MQKPTFELFYEKFLLTPQIAPDLIELTYTDYLSDQSDELQVRFADPKRKWIGAWFPNQGDRLRLQLGYEGSPLVDFGAFELDEIEWEYDAQGGSTVSLKALSTGISKANRTLKPKAFENTTLAEIVREVAKRLKLNLTGEVRDVPIKRITQYQERDVEFLTRLAHEYHHSFKIVGNTLVFTTMQSLEERSPVEVLDLGQVKSLRLRDRAKGVEKVVEVVGFDNENKTTLKATQQAKPKRNKGKEQRSDTLKIITRGESQEQIQARTDAALNAQDEQQAGNVVLVGNPKLVAGNTVWLANMGLFSGKYLIKQARHNLSRSQGYTTEIEIKLLQYSENLPNENP